MRKPDKNTNKSAKSSFVIYIILIFILTGCFLTRLYKIDNPLADWHSWRQVDTASVSKIFLKEGINILYPRYHDLSKIQTGYENSNGYRFVEFPIFNLIHVVFYKTFIFIPFEIVGRLISVFSAVFATYFIFAIGKKIFGYSVGLIAAFFYAFLPFNIYFTRVILPDPMSVAFGVASVYFFVLYAEKRKLPLLLLSAICFSVAMLIKPNSIFYGLPIAYLALTNFKLSEIFKNRWLFIAADIAIIPFLLWRLWMFQPSLIRGIAHWEWAFNGNGIRFRPAFWRWIFGERIGKIILGTWGIIPFGIGVISGRKLNIIHAFLLGGFLYVSIFASANVMHDYYQLYIIPGVSLALGLGLRQMWINKTFQPLIAKIGILFSVGLMFGLSLYEIKDNFRINDPGIVEAGSVANNILPSDAKVIAPYNGDTTFLYQTGRYGWPIVTASIDEMIDLGADYYISVNLSDKDTVDFRKKFSEVVATDRFVILDLHKRI